VAFMECCEPVTVYSAGASAMLGISAAELANAGLCGHEHG
jgi:hypothetical protein